MAILLLPKTMLALLLPQPKMKLVLLLLPVLKLKLLQPKTKLVLLLPWPKGEAGSPPAAAHR